MNGSGWLITTSITACACTKLVTRWFTSLMPSSIHAEGSTRGLVEDPEDAPLFNERWRPRSSCDPYYNPNLNRNRLLFRVEP